jgi:uncharacterized protein YacL
VSFDDWALALHVISAFALVAGIVCFWVITIAARGVDTPEATLRLGPVAKIAGGAVGIGMGGTIVLGIWLAFSVGGYNIWDAWIVVAIVLWFVGAALGRRADQAAKPAVQKALELQSSGRTGPDQELAALNRASTGVVVQALTSAVVLLIILDMIWKPGA